MNTLEEIKKERTFLHALANDVAIASGMTEISLEILEGKAFEQREQVLNKIRKTLQALHRLIEKIQIRREEVLKLQEQLGLED